MAEPKNPFDFGTGSIDKDQWLRDIDAEQGNFVSQYSSAVNKHRATLLRDAFADLRRRIANGDMLSRTADGLYQFSSALNREDKHMQEAYQRALGFMGDLARRQIQAPPATEPEKKALGNLEERYIKSLNPSGKFNTEAYWKNQTDEERRTALKDFLNKELKEAGNYQDFGNFGDRDTYTLRLLTVMNLLESGKANDWSLQQLGFTKNWLTQPTDLEETPKSEEELLDELLAAQQQLRILQLKKDAINYGNNAQVIRYDFSTPLYDILNDIINQTKHTRPGLNLTGVTPDWNKNYTDLLKQYINSSTKELNDYFSNFAVNYLSILSDKNNIPTLSRNLARLFATIPGKTPESPQLIYDWNKYLTRLPSGEFMINGTLDNNSGRFLLYNNRGISSTNLTNMDESTLKFLRDLINLNQGTSGYMKEGGVIKAQNGLDFSTIALNTTLHINLSELQKETPKLENSEEMDTGDWVTILGTTAADIGSMLSANAVGAGTAVSAGLGVASTLGNSVNDFRHGNVGSGLANLGIGLTTDLVGLIPGFGAGAKGYKIGRTLTRFARPLMAAFTANNFKEAGEVLGKGVKNGFGNLTTLDWTVLSAALTSMISRGKSAHTRLKNVEFMSKASQHSSPTDAKGNITKHIINEEGFIKARKELLEQKKFGYNTASRGYTRKVWNSIPEGGEISAPFYAKPFEWPKFGFGKNKKLKQVEEFEEFLKNNKKHEASPLDDAPVVIPNENANGFYPMIRNGAKLKALRNGGIIKAKWGDDTSDWMTPLYNPEKLEAIYTNPYFPNIKYNGTAPWYKSRFSGESVVNLGNDDSGRADLPGGLTGNNLDYAFTRNQAYVKSGLLNKLADILGYFDLLPSPVDANNLQGLTDIYNKAIDELYLPFTSGKNVPDYLKTDATKHNLLFRLVYGSRAKVNGGDDNYDIGWNPDIIKTFGSASFARRPVNYETKWEDDLKNNLAQAKDRVSKISHNGIEGYVYTDENGRIHPLTNDLLKLINGQQAPQKLEKESPKVTDSEGGIKTIFNTEYKNPNDPTPYIIAGKTAMGLLGNRNIYKNLLDEMPQAPLRDPIDRKLAIVGWLEAIKQGQNQLADLRNATLMQHGSDQLTNLAGMYETEGKGRDIMNDKFMKDSGRQFETALKSWNLDNEDYLYNIKARDDNEKAIKDRARMMAQIRAAWRSGDNNILMGALSDTGNWLMKKYQREQDIVDKAKELSLGTPEEHAQAALSNDTEYSRIMNKHAAGLTLTNEEKAYVRRMLAEALKGIRSKFASSYYNTYHTPGFGGGLYTTIAKDGTKLEVAKLKARSKDNDRYVSMMKDLRTNRSRRRRR